MNNQFYFATAKQYRIIVAPEAKTLNPFNHVNAAHSDFNIDSLWWLVLPAGGAALV